MPRVLVTGGAGYIGSHMCVELLNHGCDVTVVDNLCNASRHSLLAVEGITGRSITFINDDLRNTAAIREIFRDQNISAVLHFAGLKAVGESVAEPVRYYDNNVAGTLSLIAAMQEAGVRTLVFSSSATVYGLPESMPIAEHAPTGPINPYGRSKLMIEQILQDLHAGDDEWRISVLRYFNPVGAHESGELGEDPNDTPNNLMPFIAQVAVGRRQRLQIFGADYPTPDGTGMRDYIHVVDLARGHLAALELLGRSPGYHVHNLGTGVAYSVLDVVGAFERASGRSVPYQIVDRRAGDAAVSYADPAKAERELGWKAGFGLERMCTDAWRWQQQHPRGFTR